MVSEEMIFSLLCRHIGKIKSTPEATFLTDCNDRSSVKVCFKLNKKLNFCCADKENMRLDSFKGHNSVIHNWIKAEGRNRDLSETSFVQVWLYSNQTPILEKTNYWRTDAHYSITKAKHEQWSREFKRQYIS